MKQFSEFLGIFSLILWIVMIFQKKTKNANTSVSQSEVRHSFPLANDANS